MRGETLDAGKLTVRIESFRTVIRLMRDGVALFTDDGKLVVANDRYRETYGLEREAIQPVAPLPSLSSG